MSAGRRIRASWTRVWTRAWDRWPGSTRLLLVGIGLWAGALSALPLSTMVIAVPVAGLGFWLLSRRRHHLGVLLVLGACLFSIQLLTATAARGPEGPAFTSGVVLGHSAPGASGWTRLSVLTRTGVSEVLSPWAPPDGTAVEAETERFGEIRLARTDPSVVGEAGLIWRWRAEAREGLRVDSLSADNEGGNLLPGLVVGDTGPQSERMVEDLRVVSLTHVSAVSGSNVTIISVGAGLLAGLARAGPRTRIVVGALACLLYLFVVGFEPSAIRAAAMALVVAIVLLRGGGISPVAVLATCVCGLLCALPILGRSVGFVLSVLSTAAIVFVVPHVLRLLRSRIPILPSVLLTALTVPLIAQLACTPVLVGLDPRVGIWSVAANAVGGIAVMPATVLGFGSLLCGGIGILGVPGLLTCAQVLAWLGSGCAWWIVMVARLGASLPGAALDWPAPPWGTLLATGLLCGLALGLWLVIRRRSWGLPVMILVVCLVATTVVAMRARAPAAGWSVIVCDVGQGSAALVDLGSGHGLVVDTGKDARDVDRCLDESGLSDLDLMISHFDADHSAGYPGVAWGRRVDRLWVSEAASATAPARRAARDLGVGIRTTGRGEAEGIAQVHVQVLWPPRGPSEPSSLDADRLSPEPDPSGKGGGAQNQPELGDTSARNEDSLVVRIDVPGLSVLLPGDIGEEEQYILGQSLEPVDVLVSPHHGSGDLSPEFYLAARARLGVVSVGENRYGHPTTKALRAFGPVSVLRTDRCGTITLYPGPEFSTARNC